MKTSQDLTKIGPALVKAQAAMGAAHKDANNPFFRSKYADLETVIAAVKGPLNDNGISFVQLIQSKTHQGIAEVFHKTKDGEEFESRTPHLTTETFIETLLIHESGQVIPSMAAVRMKNNVTQKTLDETKSESDRYALQFAATNDPQKQGSGITYTKRYALQAICGLPTEDDDGNTASNKRVPQNIVHQPQQPKPTKTADDMKTDAIQAWIMKHDTAEAAILALQARYTIDAKVIQHIKSEFAKKAV